MSLIEEHTIYRITPDFIEIMEGTDTPEVGSVQQAVRFVPEASGQSALVRQLRRALNVGRPDQDVRLPLMLEQQAFQDINARAVIISAESAADLAAVRREVERVLPHGWFAVPSRFRQRHCQETAHHAGVGAFFLSKGVLKCLVS